MKVLSSFCSRRCFTQKFHTFLSYWTRADDSRNLFLCNRSDAETQFKVQCQKRRRLQLQWNPCSFQFSNIHFFSFDCRSDTQHPKSLQICREISSKWRDSCEVKKIMTFPSFLCSFESFAKYYFKNSQEKGFWTRNTLLHNKSTNVLEMTIRFSYEHAWRTLSGIVTLLLPPK